MQTKTTYIADDGTEFDNEYDCSLYESMTTQNASKIYGFDKEMDFLNDKYDAEDIASSSYYYFVADESADEMFYFINDYFGITMPTDTYCGQIVSYNEDDDSWSDVISKFHEYCRNIRKLVLSIENATKQDASALQMLCETKTKIQKIASAIFNDVGTIEVDAYGNGDVDNAEV